MFLRFLRDWAHIKLKDLRCIDVPVDVMLLRATLCAGVLRGSYEGPHGPLFGDVQRIWREATDGLTSITGEPMVPLDVDAALWRVGRYYCGHQSDQKCPCQPGCVGLTDHKEGGIWRVKTD